MAPLVANCQAEIVFLLLFSQRNYKPEAEFFDLVNIFTPSPYSCAILRCKDMEGLRQGGGGKQHHEQWASSRACAATAHAEDDAGMAACLSNGCQFNWRV